MPEVSVIVPVYNVEKYLPKCLDALIGQTLKNIEIICVNDGSTDNSLKILQEYAQKDKRIRVISQVNQGLSGARNTGLHYMQGQFVMFCDSDDWYQADMCEKMYQTIVRENVDMVLCNMAHVNVGDDNFRNYSEITRIENIGKYSLTPEKLMKINFESCNKIFKTEIIRKYRIIFPHVNPGEDLSFVHQYLAVSKNCYGLDETLYNYLMRGNSIMGQYYAKGLSGDVLLAWLYVCLFLSKHHLLAQNESLILTLVSSYLYNHWRYFKNSKEVFDLARPIVAFFSLKNYDKKDKIIRFIKADKYRALCDYMDNYNFMRKLFSIKNSMDKKYKIISLLGCRFQVKRKNKKGA